MPRSKSLRGLGAQYGGTVRKRYSNVHRLLKAKKECPSCASMKLRRLSAGVWSCKTCGFTVAGGAYDVAQSRNT